MIWHNTTRPSVTFSSLSLWKITFSEPRNRFLSAAPSFVQTKVPQWANEPENKAWFQPDEWVESRWNKATLSNKSKIIITTSSVLQVLTLSLAANLSRMLRRYLKVLLWHRRRRKPWRDPRICSVFRYLKRENSWLLRDVGLKLKCKQIRTEESLMKSLHTKTKVDQVLSTF